MAEGKNANERRRAVALRYEQEKDNAPVITAKGKGEIARKIIELAEEHDIPVREDAPLTEMLQELEVGDEIPPELYEAVAVVLAFIMEMETRHQNARE